MSSPKTSHQWSQFYELRPDLKPANDNAKADETGGARQFPAGSPALTARS